MKITSSAAVLPVSQLDTSLRYFTETLGFKLEFRFGEYAGIERDKCTIHLSQHGNPNTGAPGSGGVYIFCDEVDQYHREIAVRGAIIQEPPKDYPYGMRDFVVQDPDGNRISFGAPTPDANTSERAPLSEYLVISRGQWDPAKSLSDIQNAIDAFYVWHDRLVSEGKMRAGQRLTTERKVISKHGVSDGPYAETKEVIGGYWFFLASSFDEAAKLASENPCLACGLTFELRPIEAERASAFKVTNETPSER